MEEGTPEGKAAVVPKFASFRPKPKADPQKHGIDLGAAPDNGHDQGSHRRSGLTLSEEASRGQREGKRNHHERRERHKHHRRHRRSQSDDRSTVLVKKPAVNPEVIPWDESPEVYVIDTRGDPKNLIYGAIHQYSLPAYYRAGGGNVIGLGRESRIDRGLSNEKGIVIRSRFSGTAGSREKYVFARNERKEIKKLRIKAFDKEDAAFEATRNYIPLRLARGVKPKLIEFGNSSSSENDYRSIKGKAKAEARPEDKDLEYASESSTSDYERIEGSWDEAARQRNIELSQRVEADFMNVDAWLELVNHQDHLIRDESGRRKPTSAERLSTADIKLSMYEKALNKVGKSGGRERLLIGFMEEGSKIWDFKKLSSKWQSVLRENPSFVRLWTKYLDFRQTKAIAFRYEDLRNVYIECINVLRTTILDTAPPHCMDYLLPEQFYVNHTNAILTTALARSELEGILVYVLLRGTLFMREAGFAENAIAIWQALIELHLFAPSEITSKNCTDRRGQEVLLSSFERFWESEVPRIGEDGAEGWDTFVTNREVGNIPEPRTDSPEATIDEQRVFDSWATAEIHQAMKSRDPARTTDEVEEDDPYRVILFSDIKDFVHYFDSKQARLSLMDAFMAFCRLPPLPYSDGQSWSRAWWADSFIRNEILEQSGIYHHQHYLNDQKSRSKEYLISSSAGIESEYPNSIAQKGPFTFKFRNFPSSTETLFGDDSRWFALQDRWLNIYPGDDGPVKVDWLRRVLKNLASRAAPEYNLAIYYLAFEWKNFPEGAKKVAKSLLKKDRANFSLYNLYALLEWRSGNIDTASNVFVTTIEMSKTLGEVKQRNSILLWKTWVWELLQGDTLGAWQKLLCISEGKVTAADTWSDKGDDPYKARPAAVLKARRFLDDGRDSSLALGYNNDAVYFVECSAILEYLYHSRHADAAMAVFRKASDLFDKQGLRGCTAQELLHHGKARLLHFHATVSHSFKPSLLRDELAQSIKIFPQNTIFLSLFSWNEARSRIDNRVRSIMTDVVLKGRHDTIIGWIFSIWTELRAASGAGYNINTVRAAFERAVAIESGRSSPGLWRFYVEFECQNGDLDKAKAVFYRGLKYCPWSKGFALLAFKQLRGIGFDELRNIYRALGEKELRVHVDLENTFDAIEENHWGKRGGGDQQSGLPIALPDDMSTDEN